MRTTVRALIAACFFVAGLTLVMAIVLRDPQVAVVGVALLIPPSIATAVTSQGGDRR